MIKEVGRNRELIAEEMYLWGCSGNLKTARFDYPSCKELILKARSLVNISHERQKQLFREVLLFTMTCYEVQSCRS